ncbi:hypothetical protein BJ875DRAFT_11718 [Amylocarpus encephaloides]|uniref:Uncharacterized protein n=1 Tax=Amylocarpus encephaloides TaxID=45428 RepID=A0A9P8C5D5_9HELO|nr:hypothetical protein BJ875DRAFT_11718 [Amylocarpus encephaloides]
MAPFSWPWSPSMHGGGAVVGGKTWEGRLGKEFQASHRESRTVPPCCITSCTYCTILLLPGLSASWAALQKCKGDVQDVVSPCMNSDIISPGTEPSLDNPPLAVAVAVALTVALAVSHSHRTRIALIALTLALLPLIWPSSDLAIIIVIIIPSQCAAASPGAVSNDALQHMNHAYRLVNIAWCPHLPSRDLAPFSVSLLFLFVTFPFRYFSFSLLFLFVTFPFRYFSFSLLFLFLPFSLLFLFVTFPFPSFFFSSLFPYFSFSSPLPFLSLALPFPSRFLFLFHVLFRCLFHEGSGRRIGRGWWRGESRTEFSGRSHHKVSCTVYSTTLYSTYSRKRFLVSVDGPARVARRDSKTDPVRRYHRRYHGVLNSRNLCETISGRRAGQVSHSVSRLLVMLRTESFASIVYTYGRLDSPSEFHLAVHC